MTRPTRGQLLVTWPRLEFDSSFLRYASNNVSCPTHCVVYRVSCVPIAFTTRNSNTFFLCNRYAEFTNIACIVCIVRVFYWLCIVFLISCFISLSSFLFLFWLANCYNSWLMLIKSLEASVHRIMLFETLTAILGLFLSSSAEFVHLCPLHEGIVITSPTTGEGCLCLYCIS